MKEKTQEMKKLLLEIRRFGKDGQYPWVKIFEHEHDVARQLSEMGLIDLEIRVKETNKKQIDYIIGDNK
jgi:hypothetical protein